MPTDEDGVTVKHELVEPQWAGMEEATLDDQPDVLLTPPKTEPLSPRGVLCPSPKEQPKSEPNIDLITVKRESPTAMDILDVDMKPLVTPPTPVKTESASPPPPSALGTPTPAGSVPPTPSTSRRATKVKPAIQLIGHLPRAEDEAFKVFERIYDCHYQYGTLGRSREEFESTQCDCTFDPTRDDAEDACGKECINRMTLFECQEDECRLGKYCQNQKFRRKQYANVEIVKTEMKGFGLRAGDDIAKDTFIYEYIGDVVNEASFRKRMREYAEQGIKHFYFMMLQKGEYIDATKRGAIARFANHSCSPNCYVARWTVGKRVRMGIFSRRAIQKDEELTFNYNVDRYGHDAQKCYCGEPNCVGFIGGKTQTDVGAMDDLYLDALGITDEVEMLGLKGNKKKKGKKLDEDYMPILKPLVEKDVPKVIQAMRQTQSRKVLYKLLTRIKMTEDIPALRLLMRLRAFAVMTNIMQDYAQDLEISVLAMECMMTWPLLQRNKVEDSKVSIPVEVCAKSENDTCRAIAEKLLALWATLESGYRIPKRQKMDDDGDTQSTTLEDSSHQADMRPAKRSRASDVYEDVKFTLATKSEEARDSGVPQQTQTSTDETKPRTPTAMETRGAVLNVLAAARARAAAEAEKKASEAAAAAEALAKREARRAAKAAEKKPLTAEEKEANKEKRLLKLVGAVVVKCMSKHKDRFEKEEFKKCAKELTNIIAEKEKKSSSYPGDKLEGLSDEKTVKIKKFAKEYIHKVLHKLEKSKHRSHSRSSRPSSSKASTSALRGDTEPPDREDDDGEGKAVMDMSVEEAMGMDLDELLEGDPDGDGDEDGDDDADMDASAEDQTSPSLKTPDEDPMDVDSTVKVVSQSESPHPVPGSKTLGDPRKRGKIDIVWHSDKAKGLF